MKKISALKIFFVVYIIAIVFANMYFVLAKSPSGTISGSALSGITNTSLQILDGVLQPELAKTDNYTGILIMGIDDRENTFDGERFRGRDRDIDSIIQIVLNHDTGDVFMLSIPRDTGVTISETCAGQSRQYFRSINHAYKLGEDGKCPGGGVELMKKYVTYITGFTNHYFSLISYNAFKDIINAVGDDQDGKKGLFIDVPRNIQEYYPREVGGGYESVFFRKGYQFIDTDRLLKYARSRQATSDFDRARRQQQVLDALQAKVTSADTLANPTSLLGLYESFQTNALFTPVGIEEITAALGFYAAHPDYKIHQLVLDDTLAGLNALITRPSYSGRGQHQRPGYYLSPMAFNSPECRDRNDEYCKVKDYLVRVFNNAWIIEENAGIYAYSNVVGRTVTNEAFEAGKKDLAVEMVISRFALAGREGWGDVQIYDFSDGTKTRTKGALEEAFQTQVRDGSEAAFNRVNNEDFAIIVKTN